MKKCLFILLTSMLLVGCGVTVPDGMNCFDNTRDFFNTVPEEYALLLAESIGEDEKYMYDSYMFSSYNENDKSVEVVCTYGEMTITLLYTYDEESNDFTVTLK